MGFSQWSTDPDANQFVETTFIGEGCPAGNVNNGMRTIMSDLRSAINPALDAGLADGSLGGVTGTLASIAALGTVADRMLYSTAPQTFQEAVLTAFARSLLDDTDAATARVTLGAIAIDSMSLAVPGFIKFKLPTGEVFGIQWGTVSASANGTTSVTYPSTFSNFSIAQVSGAALSTGAQDNNPAISGTSAAGFTIFSAVDGTVSCWWIAVGV